MDRTIMLIRFGYCCGAAEHMLKDSSYSKQYIGHEKLVTPEVYTRVTREISERLIAAGFLGPDEDLLVRDGIILEEGEQ